MNHTHLLHGGQPCALCWGWSAVSKQHKFHNSGKPRSENVTLNWKVLCISMCVRDKQMNTVSVIIWLAPSTDECDASETQHHTEKTLFVLKLMSGSQQGPGRSYCITFLQMLLLLYWYCDYTVYILRSILETRIDLYFNPNVSPDPRLYKMSRFSFIICFWTLLGTKLKPITSNNKAEN